MNEINLVIVYYETSKKMIVKSVTNILIDCLM